MIGAYPIKINAEYINKEKEKNIINESRKEREKERKKTMLLY